MASVRERMEGMEGLKVKVNWREVKISDLIYFLSNISLNLFITKKFHFR